MMIDNAENNTSDLNSSKKYFSGEVQQIWAGKLMVHGFISFSWIGLK